MIKMAGIAVIGGAGKMGKWFSSYFSKKGFEVSIFDTSSDSKNFSEEIGARHCRDVSDAVSGSEFILVSVPLQKTTASLDEILPLLKGNQVILDISSVKQNIFSKLKKSKRKFVSFHPLFGSSASSLNNQEIIFINGSTSSHSKTLKELFSLDGAKISEMSAKEHDELMSTIQQLPILLNLVFAEALSEKTSALSHGAPTFNSQLELCRRVLSEDSGFYSFMQTENKFAKNTAKKLSKILSKYNLLLKNSDSKEIARRFSELREMLK